MTDQFQTVEINPSFALEVADVTDDRPPHILVCVHGIRDDGAWCNITATAPGKFLDTTIEIACVRYKRLSSWGFIFGLRQAAIKKSVIDQIKFIRERFPESTFSVLCHSNGTKIIAAIIDELDFQFEWIFLCGSVCHLEDVKRLRKVKRNTVNDAATKDWWPIIAEVLRPSMFQATGVIGFHQFPIMERSFTYRHGGGVTKKHIEDWVFPTLVSGNVQRTTVIDVGIKKHLPVYLRRGLIFVISILIWWFFLVPWIPFLLSFAVSVLIAFLL